MRMLLQCLNNPVFYAGEVQILAGIEKRLDDLFVSSYKTAILHQVNVLLKDCPHKDYNLRWEWLIKAARKRCEELNGKLKYKDVLLEIQANNLKQAGICEATSITLNTYAAEPESFRLVRDEQRRLIDSWPKHSGDSVYPVPSVTPNRTAYSEFHHNILNSQPLRTTLWVGEYGELRNELLQFMIDNVGDVELELRY